MYDLENMTSYRESYPKSLLLVDLALKHLSDPLVIPFFGMITASDGGWQEIAQHDGASVDKSRDGILAYANELSGSDRSAFCPIDSPVWHLRDVIYRYFGAHTNQRHMPKIIELTNSYLSGPEDVISNNVDVASYSRELIFLIGSELIFNLPITKLKARDLSEAYKTFNRWAAISTLTGGLVDIGRNPKLSHYSIISNGQEATKKMSGLFFAQQHREVNNSIEIISGYAKDVWQHIKDTNHPMYLEYVGLQSKHNLNESQVIVELTNLMGGIFSSPPSHLSFLISVFARTSTNNQQLIRDNPEYRDAFTQEIKRYFTPFPWLMRDVNEGVMVGKRLLRNGNYIVYNYTYNRRPDIWGADAELFNPNRFLDNPGLKSKSTYFGKGRRRCPAGEVGESIANNCFNELIQRFDISADTKLGIQLRDNIYPKGNVIFSKL